MSAHPSFTGPELLTRVAARLGAPHDHTVLEEVANDLLALADCCTIDVSEDGRQSFRLQAVAHRDNAAVDRAREARRQHPAGGAPLAATLYTTADAGDDALAQALGWTSWIIAPLRAHGETVGSLTLATRDPARPLDAGAVELAACVGTLAGLAVSRQRVARERDEFLTVVSHDMRNPLGVILLVVDLLRQSPATPALVGQLARLERGAQTMGRILTDLVDAGRLGANSVPLETEVVAVGRVVADACDPCQAAADQKGVTLDRSKVAGVELRADRQRVTRMVEQLVQSAVARTPSGQKVTVTVETRGEGTLWSIADSAAKTLAGLEESPARRAGPLGWLVARGVVHAHGGSLWIDGGGPDGTFTVVRFILPAAPRAA